LQDKDLGRSQVVVCKIPEIQGGRTHPPNRCYGRLYVQSRVVVCKIGQTPVQVPPLLLGPVAQDRLGVGGAILLPIAGVVGAPLPGAVAADLAILGIADELLLAAPPATLLLAGGVRAGGLRGMKSRCFERPVAKKATPLVHLFRVRDVPQLAHHLGKKAGNWKRIEPRRYGYTGG
jgi:hypothetical protein